MDNPTVLFVMGALLIGFVLLRRSQRRGRLEMPRPVSPPPHRPHAPAGHHLDAPGAMSRWEVEMHELSRDLLGRLDSKIVIVEQLVHDAAAAAARLEAAIARAEHVGLWQRGLGRAEDERFAEQSDTETIHAKPLGNRPGAAEPDLPELDSIDQRVATARATAALVQRTERVYRLADRGLSGAQIVAELGEPLGEVELILSVHPRAQTK